MKPNIGETFVLLLGFANAQRQPTTGSILMALFIFCPVQRHLMADGSSKVLSQVPN
ncbi:hypothetical protein IQ249_03835 [Lusitaniella coriacea LEGE 07157]|uniref:Uncharacterized protein n=1 Tax=Lusitaniella coriacea LEGE 07157 TaxID=945747 RepID=A0A8J7B719_9CYAN|nr:hypothetical protein [Lusitaniella coriacea]MBE9115024.1 hypothetical protein [Lusitaniella coriacea LEGE 07157]